MQYPGRVRELKGQVPGRVQEPGRVHEHGRAGVCEYVGAA